MNANFFFLIFAFALFAFSVITITIAPIISKAHITFFDGWGTANCEILEEDLDFVKSIGTYDEDKQAKEIEERKIDECRNHKAMYSLEYAALVIDVSLGFIIMVLAIIHVTEPGHKFEKISGILGLIIGAISTIITCVYLGYSGYIFNNQPIRTIVKLYSNKASWKWNGNAYITEYSQEEVNDDYDEQYIKVRDLGKKQYNYDSDLYQASLKSSSEYNGCQRTMVPSSKQTYLSGSKECQYIWKMDVDNQSNYNKYLYDRWLASLIFSALICACGIGLAIFGFFLFTKEKGEYEQSNPIPVTSSINRLKNEPKSSE